MHPYHPEKVQRNKHIATHYLVRMLSRNEKSLARVELAQWLDTMGRDALGGKDDPSTLWYEACAHKHGLGCVQILRQAGIPLRSWRPVRDALLRGLDEVAWAMADAVVDMEPLQPWPGKPPHILVEVMRRGRADVLARLFDKATPVHLHDIGAHHDGTLVDETKANYLLLLLCKTHPEKMVADPAAVVEFLLARGGDPNFSLSSGSSVSDRLPLVYQAARAANTATLRALAAQGGDVRHTHAQETHMPHPYPNATTAVLYGVRDGYQHTRKITDAQWQTLDYLAEQGVPLDPQGMDAMLKLLPYNVSNEEKGRLVSIAQHARLVEATPTSTRRGSTLRL